MAMSDFSFLNLSEPQDIGGLSFSLGPRDDNTQSDSRLIPDVEVSMPDDSEQDRQQTRRSSWASEDGTKQDVLETSHKTAAEEVHSRLWYEAYNPSKTSTTSYKMYRRGSQCFQPRSHAQAIDEYYDEGESNPAQRIMMPDPQPPSLDASGDHEYCDDCETFGPNRSYCNVCTFSMCEYCWKRQLTHKNNASQNDIPHEKTPRSLARKTQAVFNPNIGEDERQKLHCEDVLTSWFGVHREDSARPLLRDYGRFEGLMASTRQLAEENHSYLDPSARYPSFVSFVGQTGAGKSSLIKLIIDLGAKTPALFDTPVVGAVGNTSPTSTDVHLYVDPPTVDSDHPILYADCEGLEGGEREPVAAKAIKQRAKKAIPGVSDHSFHHVSERDLIWADKSWRKTREFAVRELYPRLLYTFSDVIVFVLKNPKVIESVLVKLVEWAAAALEGSSNQPVLPHAIIALNASENATSTELWDVDIATTTLMKEMSQTVFQNETLKKYVQFWHKRDRIIRTVEDLILSYYTSIKVVRIPTTGRPNLIAKQINDLTANIRSACQVSGRPKGDLRMLLNAEDMQPYLQYAFDHFSKSIESPFDFVQASFAHSPIPDDFGGNILKLAVQLMEAWKDRAGPRPIFEELAVVVASCIMLDATRHGILGTAVDIVPPYFEHLDNALMNFCDRYWPCEYVRPGKGRCVNVRSGHTKGHQSSSGKVLAGGDYESQFTFDAFREHFRNEVYVALHELLCNLPRNHLCADSPEVNAATDQHKNKVLKPFFAHALEGNDTYDFSSHTVCFCCLFDFPEHTLPCGHVICTGCLKAYGHVTKEHTVEFWECPMDGKILGYTPFYLKPPHCGVRILTLDGGGVRGIAELEILKQIENALGNGILRIQDFLDFVVGTSTGGIIALGLVSKGWSVDDCTRKFENLCHKAFQERMMARGPFLGRLIRSYYHSLYETAAIEGALKEAFTESADLFGAKPTSSGMYGIKVAVTATADLRDITARATSAAPLYFTPFNHAGSKQTYYDGGVHHNNPVKIADSERKLIWPDLKEPDVTISVGTGHNLTKLEKRKAAAFKPTATRGIIAQGVFLAKMAKDHIAVSLDSEQTWKDFLASSKKSDDRFRYVRLNTSFPTDPPLLDDLSMLSELREMAKKQFAGQYQTNMLALKLVATSFYFQPDETDPLKRKEVTGYIRCRFPDDDPRISALGTFIFEKTGIANEAYFLISEQGQAGSHTTVKLGAEVLERMIRNCQFQLKQIKIPVSNEIYKTNIALRYGAGQEFPISGTSENPDVYRNNSLGGSDPKSAAQADQMVTP
ncbi:hypothetical protein D6D20_08067 [Aureobasidium pullulans]|uniref:PNPLA domain-containing protein n=1 Tax=Aureobasidium pullulans TaxID=5580 RepID=A0A4S8YZL3_AURPU|nr:hypothetical protein D6D20_08067 [Aureobasidium pullulans]